MRNFNQDFRVGLKHCIDNKRIDFILLSIFPILVPLLMILLVSGLSGKLIINEITNPYIIGMFLFLLSIAISKPLIVYYGEIERKRVLADRVMRVTNHFALSLFSFALLDMYFSKEANINALYIALLMNSYTLSVFIRFCHAMNNKKGS